MSAYVCSKRLEEITHNLFCSGCRTMSFCLPSSYEIFYFFKMLILSVKILEWGSFQIGKGFKCGKTKKYKCLLQADIIALCLYIYAQSLSCI